jgi:DNA-binding MarR family transcriptional regulator
MKALKSSGKCQGFFYIYSRMKIEEQIKQPKFRNSLQRAVVNLLYTANWVQYKQQDFFKSHGITGQQFNILRILKGQHPKSISASEIKSRMLDMNSDVSRLLDRLEVKALISKKACPGDKRATDVNITEQGLDVLREIDKNQAEMDQLLGLTEEEADYLSNLLDKCRNGSK